MMNFFYQFCQPVAVILVLAGCLAGCTPDNPAVTAANPNYVGGPLALAQAKQIANTASQQLAAQGGVDAKLRAAFEDSIVDLLACKNSQRRAVAASELGELRKPQAVEALLLGVEDENAAVREKSIEALRWIGDKTAGPRVAGALGDGSPEVRTAAATALGRLGDRQTLAALIAGLKDSDPRVRTACTASLGQMRDPAAASDLAVVLQNDPAPNVRATSAGALGLIKDPRSTPALVAALKDRDALVRYQVIGAIEAVGDPKTVAPLSALLQDPDETVRTRAKHAIDNMKN